MRMESVHWERLGAHRKQGGPPGLQLFLLPESPKKPNTPPDELRWEVPEAEEQQPLVSKDAMMPSKPPCAQPSVVLAAAARGEPHREMLPTGSHPWSPSPEVAPCC